MEKFFLNLEQRLAVEHEKGPCLVLAGPGTGKTAVIAGRVLRLIEKGTRPERILVITFTRAAAAEMRDRYEKMSEDVKLKAKDIYIGEPMFCTFHSLCFFFLREEGWCGTDGVLSDKEMWRIATQTVTDVLMEAPLSQIRAWTKRLMKAVTSERNLPYIFENDQKTLRKLTAVYREKLAEYGKVGFGDMIRECLEMFRSDADALMHRQRDYDFILIDESQDLSAEQMEIAELLAAAHENLFLVGDDDQSIYGFRGVSPKRMFDFERAHAKTHVIKLRLCYRCEPQILKCANRLIGRNRIRYKKALTAVEKYMPKNTAAESDVKMLRASADKYKAREAVIYDVFDDEMSEASAVAEKINALRAGGVSGKIAVLCRTSGQIRVFQSVFDREGTPYSLTAKEDANFYDMRLQRRNSHGGYEELYDGLEAICALVKETRARKNWERTHLNTALFSIETELYCVKALDENINPKEWAEYFRSDKALYCAAEKFIRDMDILSKADGYSFGMYLWYGMNYKEKVIGFKKNQVPYGIDKELGSYSAGSENDRAREKFLALAEDVFRRKMSIKSNPLKNRILWNVSEETLANAVKLMTIHASKGMEFDTVFIPTLNEGVLPHANSKSAQEIEEERRLFYVALTRAKERVYLSGVVKKHGHRPAPSRFIKECL